MLNSGDKIKQQTVRIISLKETGFEFKVLCQNVSSSTLQCTFSVRFYPHDLLIHRVNSTSELTELNLYMRLAADFISKSWELLLFRKGKYCNELGHQNKTYSCCVCCVGILEMILSVLLSSYKFIVWQPNNNHDSLHTLLDRVINVNM